LLRQSCEELAIGSSEEVWVAQKVVRYTLLMATSPTKVSAIWAGFKENNKEESKNGVTTRTIDLASIDRA
jgi:hypothetical protein